MSKYVYASCPHCGHPNIHVYAGRLGAHTESVVSDTPCPGSGTIADNPQPTPHESNKPSNGWRAAAEKAGFSDPNVLALIERAAKAGLFQRS